MRFWGLLIPLLLLGGLFFNAGRQVYVWLKAVFPGIRPWICGIVYSVWIVLTMVVYVVSRTPGIGWPRILFTIDHYALGVLVYVVLIVNVISLLLGLGKLVRLIPSPTPRKLQWISGGVALLLVVSVSLYGSLHALDIRTQRYAVEIDRGQSAGGSLRIALVSDLHLGYVMDEHRLAKVVEEVNAMQPDIVCIAGDVFDGDTTALSDPEELQELLRSLDATYGVYACLGNHDAGDTYDRMLAFLSAADVQLLQDEGVVIDGRFVLAGRRDSSPIGGHGTDRQALTLPQEAAELPVIVMDHQPGNIGAYGSEADLILCGHTHQGQMFPANLITNAIYEVDHGYYRASDTAPQVIVTSGAGTWGPPLRVGTDSEVAEIAVTFQ